MAAFDFPNSPSTNDTYTANGMTFTWNGTMWKRTSPSVGAQGATGPTGAQGNQGNTGTTGTVFTSGTRMLFQQSTAPTGWTKITSGVNDRALRLVSGNVSSGGDYSFSSRFKSSYYVKYLLSK